MARQRGSYRLSNFADGDGEIARLHVQATIFDAIDWPMLEQAGLRDGMRVLEVACGPGAVTTRIAGRVPGAQVVAVDRDPGMLRRARAATDAAGCGHVSLAAGELYALPFAAGTFDFCVMRFVLQHLHRPADALAEGLRLLAPGGRLCAIDADDGWLSLYPEPPVFRALVETSGTRQVAANGNRHIGRKLGVMLAEAGFESCEVDVRVVTTSRFSRADFVASALSFRVDDDATAYDPDRARTELRDWADDAARPAWGYVGIFGAWGRKPGGG
ncbi:MAG: methyltransferase domain-containing protein [Rhodospirillaceae bacterium]|nr:methyltransferase domain-containing protein [Rhodospirillaceae bacterium]